MIAKLRCLEMMERKIGEGGKPLWREHNLTPDDFVKHLQTPTTGRRVLVSKMFLDEETTVFEVKVVSKHISNEDVYEETEAINCHVCDEIIPRGYFREHAQSAIHQNNKKISGMYLEGLMNDTKLLGTNQISNMQCDSYYCSSCIKLVPRDQTLAHGLSVEHHKAIDRKTALNAFIEKYVDTKPQSQEPQSVISNPIENIFHREKNDRCSPDLVGPERTQINRNPPPVTETTSVNRVSYKKCEICDIEIHRKKYQQHLRRKSHRKKKNKIKVQTKRSLQTLKDQESVASTSRDDRNSTTDVEDFMAYFKKMVSKYNLSYKLPFVKEGGLLVVTPHGYGAVVTVESFHGYRPTQNGVYCQLCGMTISTDTRVHSETLVHVKHITQCIDQHFTRKISLVKSHCVLCNTTVLDAAKHSVSDPQHNSYMQARVSSYRPVDGSDPNSYQDHIKGQQHFKSINKNCEQRETPANVIFCDVCTKTMLCINFQEHCKGKNHIVNAKRTGRDPQTVPVEHPDVGRSSPTAVNQPEPNFLEYLMTMIAKYNLKCALPEVEHDGVLIKTPKGYRDKFSFEVFHSYKQSESSVVCQVCRMNVLSKDTTAHSMTRPHVVNILQPVDDNFSRKINKSWNHCLVCNITVLNNFNHACYSHIHRNINGPGARSGDGNAEKMFCNGNCG